MNATPNSFTVPREQWLAWKYFAVKSRRSVQEHRSASSNPLYFFWARNAIYHALQELRVPRNSRALLPAYLCRAAAEPFAAYGLECDYYDLKRDCTPDFRELEKKVQPATRVVLAVHYFGFPQRIQEFKDLCCRNNVLLFEDCAHVLRSEYQGKRLGTFGDASVFSYRKFLPMFDGAELLFATTEKSNWKSEHSRFEKQSARFIASLTLNNSASLVAKCFRGVLEVTRSRRDTTNLDDRVPASREPAIDNNSSTFDESLLNQPMSGPSGWLLRHSNMGAVIEKRRANFQFLHNALCDAPGITPLFEDLPQNVCPWVYPVFVDGMANSHLRLRAAGIPAVTWGGVRVENIQARDFPGADFLYDNLVFLPIHQNLTNTHLRMIAEATKKIGIPANDRDLERMRSTS